MATKEEAQSLYDRLREMLDMGRRKAEKVPAIADQVDGIIAEITADADLKTKVQACIDAGPDTLTGLKADAAAIRAVAAVVVEKYPPPEPVQE